MMKSRDLSHINSMADLQQEQLRVQQELKDSHEELSQLINTLPVRAMGSMFSWVATSVVQAVVNKWATSTPEAAPEVDPITPDTKSSLEGAAEEKTPLQEEFKAAGIETLQFALGKTLEILLKR